MIEPSQREVYRLCGIEQPEWCVSGEGMVNVGKGSEPIGAMVALRWIVLLDGRPYTRTSDGPYYDVYESWGASLRVKVG